MKTVYLRTFSIVGAAAGIGLLFAVSHPLAQDAPFGDQQNVDYAKKLWAVMEDAKLVGDDSIKVHPFEGNEPHGAIQEVLTTTATIDGHTGTLIVKRNHMGDDVSVEAVADDPIKYLDAVTVMFKREEGYDADNQNWFWAKYRAATGELDKNPKGMQLAGRVAKGADQGCIACHTGAGGEDLRVLTSN